MIKDYKKVIFFSFACLMLSSCFLQRNPVKHIYKDSNILHNAELAYYFKKISSDEPLFAQDEDQLMIPASGIKLLTLLSSLKVFGDSLPTGCLYKDRDSTIYIPSGNPSFFYHQLSDLSIIEQLNSVKSKNLAVAIPKHDGETYGNAWAWNDDGKTFQTGRHPLFIYGGRMRISKDDDRKIRVPGKMLDKNFIFQPSSGKSSSELKLKKMPYKNEIKLNRKINKNDSFNFEFSFFPETELLIDLLSDTLQKPVGISYYVPPKRQCKCFKQVAYPIYKQMMAISDNSIAEQLMYMIGYEARGIFSTRYGIDFCSKNLVLGVDPEKMQWVDGSGLSRKNLISPKSLASIIEQMIVDYDVEFVQELLPSPDKDNTLSAYIDTEDDAPYLWAKTGSMDNIYSLTGILKNMDSEIIAFSLMINNSLGRRKDHEKICRKIVKNIRAF